jgi:hypothetical protein
MVMGVDASEEVYVEIKRLLAIPEDEPIFILRGQDKRSPGVIVSYLHACGKSAAHSERIQYVLGLFRDFQLKYPGRVKEPD